LLRGIASFSITPISARSLRSVSSALLMPQGCSVSIRLVMPRSRCSSPGRSCVEARGRSARRGCHSPSSACWRAAISKSAWASGGGGGAGRGRAGDGGGTELVALEACPRGAARGYPPFDFRRGGAPFEDELIEPLVEASKSICELCGQVVPAITGGRLLRMSIDVNEGIELLGEPVETPLEPRPFPPPISPVLPLS